MVTTESHKYFRHGSLFKRASYKRLICDHLFQVEHKLMTKILNPLCYHSTDRYHFNILRNIAIIYHIYIECEL